uniref:Uncharacterized protein n=1 Tax=Trichogramma kaykai TaxID=54128 RepID=A0ABD2WM84_9HYME
MMNYHDTSVDLLFYDLRMNIFIGMNHAKGSGTYGGRERKFISDECIVSSATCALRINISILFDLEKERENIVGCAWKRV